MSAVRFCPWPPSPQRHRLAMALFLSGSGISCRQADHQQGNSVEDQVDAHEQAHQPAGLEGPAGDENQGQYGRDQPAEQQPAPPRHGPEGQGKADSGEGREQEIENQHQPDGCRPGHRMEGDQQADHQQDHRLEPGQQAALVAIPGEIQAHQSGSDQQRPHQQRQGEGQHLRHHHAKRPEDQHQHAGDHHAPAGALVHDDLENHL